MTGINMKDEGPTVTSCLQLKLWRTQRGHAGCSVQSAGDCSIFGCVYQKFTPKRLFQPEARSGSGFGTRDLVFLHPTYQVFSCTDLTLQLSQWITNMLNWEGVVITFTAVIRSRGLPSYLAIPLSRNPSSKMWLPFMSHFLPQFLIICINWKFMHMEKIVQNQQYFL